MKFLNGSELAGFIKQRHSMQVKSLASSKVFPKLAIIQAEDDPVINTYVRLKNRYGSDIGIAVEVHKPSQEELPEMITRLNRDDSVHGIIVQLPLPDPSQTDEITNLVSPEKDVDALGKKSKFEPATPMAILWLLAGYNINLKDKKIVLIGKGKLVGAPLQKILEVSKLDVEVVDRETKDLALVTKSADILITAANSAEIISSDMIAQNAVVVDAGVASEDGKTVGNLKAEVYERDDLTLTPTKGGVGPLTVCALFENVIRAAQNVQN